MTSQRLPLGCLVIATVLTACSSSRPTTSPLVTSVATSGPATSKTTATTSTAAKPPSPTFSSINITFTTPSGLGTNGTVTTPASAGKHPAVLFIAGSGPTDRNGDGALLPGKIGTLRFLAETVATDAVTLRFDKLGVGKSQVPADLTAVTFDDFVAQATAARDWLSQQPSVDPARVVIAGHSEGGLIALVLATQTPSPTTKLALFSPPGGSYLSVIRDQLATQLSADVLRTYDALAAELRTTGSIASPPEDRALASVFNRLTLKFLASADRYDPVALAGNLNASTLLTCGERDVQVPCSSLAHLRSALTSGLAARFTDVELKGTNHVLRTTGLAAGTPDTYTNDTYPLNAEAAAALQMLITEG
jgi:uncharacterized protein